ncbi:MAG: hypothetical protein H6Q19_870 [Bacteroidetes bacterium]|nr:hypothetical protein [Bacteroidota bacterium]
MKKTFILSSILLFQLMLSAQASKPAITNVSKDYRVAVPVQGNSWLTDNAPRTSAVINRHLSGWSNKKDIIRTYFYVQKACRLNVAIEASVISGTSVIEVSSGKLSKKLSLSNTSAMPIAAGKLDINAPGYYYVDLKGVSKTARNFAVVTNILLGGDADKNFIRFVDQDFYFGRRGPSVHLNYLRPEGVKDVEWYYNELEVNEGDDVIGSYFMANGFNEGYFGMQVNSASERRILFSVWSPFKTDDPKAIPADEKIKLIAKGEHTLVGEFGNEGSGGQSYLIYDWKPGVRYKFLLQGKPQTDNTTTYTAWLYDPQSAKWVLIASFNRPKTSTYLRGFHSFVENFIPDYGAKTRKCNYYNQWVADKDGNWTEVTEAMFTYDATAQANRRFDYAGGAAGDGFFLKMGGFFNENTSFRTNFQRTKTDKSPDIKFAELPGIH